MSTIVGMDGCRAGWFYFRRDGAIISHGVISSIHNLTSSLPEDSRVFIDIPIGLIDHGPTGRVCDSAARKLLGPRGVAVFSAPCRPVLEAKNYEEAKEISFNAIGKKLSQQAFAITSKIKEVDDYLVNRTENIAVREVHPEVCFWALNNRSPIFTRKTGTSGFEERKKLLSSYILNIDDLVDGALSSYLRKEVARDDVLDALVALVVASTSDDSLQSIPIESVFDSQGLRMEMVYTSQPNEGAL